MIVIDEDVPNPGSEDRCVDRKRLKQKLLEG